LPGDIGGAAKQDKKANTRGHQQQQHHAGDDGNEWDGAFLGGCGGRYREGGGGLGLGQTGPALDTFGRVRGVGSATRRTCDGLSRAGLLRP
jgi:hypothetical protein